MTKFCENFEKIFVKTPDLSAKSSHLVKKFIIGCISTFIARCLSAFVKNLQIFVTFFRYLTGCMNTVKEKGMFHISFTNIAQIIIRNILVL